MTSGSPDYSPRIVSSGSATEQLKASVTATETIATFTQTVLSFMILNEGDNYVYFDRETGVTTDSFRISPGAGIAVDVPTLNLYFICDTDETATVKIIGIY